MYVLLPLPLLEMILISKKGLKGCCCPCFVYGKTQHRLRDPTLQNYESMNTDVCLPLLPLPQSVPQSHSILITFFPVPSYLSTSFSSSALIPRSTNNPHSVSSGAASNPSSAAAGSSPACKEAMSVPAITSPEVDVAIAALRFVVRAVLLFRMRRRLWDGLRGMLWGVWCSRGISSRKGWLCRRSSRCNIRGCEERWKFGEGRG